LQLPGEIGVFLGEPVEEKVRILIVLELYKQEKISFGKVKELAGLDTWEMLDILVKHDIHLDYTAKDLEEDIQTFKQVSIK